MPMLKLVPTLIVDDMPAANAFYHDVLEFELVDAQPPAEPWWARLRCGGAEIMLQMRQSLLEEYPFYRDLPLGGTFDLYIEMDGIDEYYARVKTRITPYFELAERLYGMRDFTIRDCNGYVVSFGQSMG
jgi:catechol 2,3-dioxygenase-like lactoylglutathione lyase family enzyme